jgi:hypothetical protein
VILQTALDHDVSAFGIFGMPDFSVRYIKICGLELSWLTISQQAKTLFPFVDRLNGGYTAMTYSASILMSNNLVAIFGASLYGLAITPATFDPPCDAYAYVDNAPAAGSVYFKAFANDNPSTPSIEWTMTPVQDSPYSTDL